VLGALSVLFLIGNRDLNAAAVAAANGSRDLSEGRARSLAIRTVTRLDPGAPELLLSGVQDGLFR
jgi:hypothetical protein